MQEILMEWLLFIILAIIALIIILPSPKKLAAATNALLAEYHLRHIELVPENTFTKELNEAIISVWRYSGFPNITEQTVMDDFNSSSRFIQLNIVAMALNELGSFPYLENEYWQPVKNPFRTGRDYKKYLRTVSARLSAKHGVNIEIPDKKLQMKDWGLSDTYN